MVCDPTRNARSTSRRDNSGPGYNTERGAALSTRSGLLRPGKMGDLSSTSGICYSESEGAVYRRGDTRKKRGAESVQRPDRKECEKSRIRGDCGEVARRY